MLTLKLILVPLLIGLVSLAARRWGPGISGLLAALPWTSGPVLLFLALERGPAFAADSATGILGGVISVTAFCVAYARASRRRRWPDCLGLGIAAYLVVTFVLLEMRLSLAPTFAAVALVVALAATTMGRAWIGYAPGRPGRWDLPLRMMSATALVIALTALAGALGPRLAGLLAPFPVYASVLAVFAHRDGGAGAALATLHGVVRGSFSFAIFFLVAAIAIEPSGVAASMLTATVSAISLHVLLIGRDRSFACAPERFSERVLTAQRGDG